ncbi:MAG: hypothetical protein CMB64_06965 [Euryarchaeota archaeon]|nr:hypothetical protein [Euryarchaeota archaeon]
MGDNTTANQDGNSNTSLKKIIKDLLAKERRAHLLTIIIFAPTLYLLGQWNILTPTLGAFAFVSLMTGYIILALLALNENTRKITQIKYDNDFSENDSISKRIVLNIISALKIIAIPLIISILVFGLLYALMSENKVLSTVGVGIPIILASLFILWSASQAITYKSSVSMWINEKIKVDATKNNFDIKKNSIIQLTIVGISSGLVSYIMLILLDEGEGYNGILGVIIVMLTTIITHSLILWNSKENREGLMSRKDGNKIEIVWGISLHIFAAWHFLSFYRRIVSNENMTFNLIEEVILMIFTVVMSIWSISTKGVKKNVRYFIPENILFWGIAFGFGYAGSVTMLAVGLEGDITFIFAFGHLITWLTLLVMHKQSCKDFLTSRL